MRGNVCEMLSLHGIEESRGFNLQTFSQLDDVDEAHVTLSSLYPAHIVPMQIS